MDAQTWKKRINSIAAGSVLQAGDFGQSDKCIVWVEIDQLIEAAHVGVRPNPIDIFS